MMTQAFYTGVSGIKTNSFGIDVVSDNLANVNTAGFRGSNAEFSSLFENMLSTTSAGSSVDSSVGVGVNVQATPMNTTYGSPMLTDKSTDLALFGDGWFGIEGNGKPLYTRNGNFSFDRNNDLVTQDGYHVLGTMGNNISGNTLSSKLSNVPLSGVDAQTQLRFPKFLTYPAEPTTNVKFLGNLGTDAQTRSMSAGVVDSQDNKNTLKLIFTKSAIQPSSGIQWDVVATVKSPDNQTLYDTKTGVVNFDATGALISNTLTNIDNNGSNVAINLGQDFGGIVSIANTPISSSSTTDGTKGGDLSGYDINKNGEVVATFTNGMQSSVGKIAVYHFINNQGLDRISGTTFEESSNSGKPLFYKDANGNNITGTDIANHKLESSNVSVENGLTQLIVLQRAFDANAKSITTADQMIQKALNMAKH